MATIADVARAAGVSIATVSRVLSPAPVPHPVRAETAQRVRAAALDLNFVPSPLARGLAIRKSGLIGLIVPDLADPHYPHIASGVEERARSAELAVLICNTLGDPRRMADYVLLLQARRVDAVVLSGGTSLRAEDLTALLATDVPRVFIGRPAIPMPWPHVSIDNVGGAIEATRHLIGLGFNRIVHLGGPPSQTTMADRAEGYLDAMRGKFGVEVIDTNGTPEDGYQQLRRRLNRQPPVNAVFAATDRLAIAALELAADRGLHVPHELAIIGFDDIALGAHLRPSLSTVAQPAHKLGTVAIDLVLRVLADADERVRPVTLPTKLVARESTAGPGGRYMRSV
jgi:LacI family transcriptional regulator